MSSGFPEPPMRADQTGFFRRPGTRGPVPSRRAELAAMLVPALVLAAVAVVRASGGGVAFAQTVTPAVTRQAGVMGNATGGLPGDEARVPTMRFPAPPLPAAEPWRSRVLRVCADPNNLPFSSRRAEGIENRLADLVARELGARVEYTWWAERRGFFGHTLKPGRCDVVMGIPSGYDLMLTTRPYYRSTYVFVSRRGEPAVRSFDDPRLRTATVGVQLVGDDGQNTPPAHALARRGIVDNVRGYMLYGDYREPDPPARIVDAVARREVDVAVVWGPLAGFFARRAATPLVVTPAAVQRDGPMPLAFDIALGVRKRDAALRDTLDAILVRRRAEVERLLDDYGVPRVPGMAASAKTEDDGR